MTPIPKALLGVGLAAMLLKPSKEQIGDEDFKKLCVNAFVTAMSRKLRPMMKENTKRRPQGIHKRGAYGKRNGSISQRATSAGQKIRKRKTSPRLYLKASPRVRPWIAAYRSALCPYLHLRRCGESEARHYWCRVHGPFIATRAQRGYVCGALIVMFPDASKV